MALDGRVAEAQRLVARTAARAAGPLRRLAGRTTPVLDRELISRGIALRLFLVGALVLVCAYLRPVAAPALPAAAFPACVSGHEATAVLDADAPDASLRLENGQAQTLGQKASRDGRSAPRRPRIPVPVAAPRSPALRVRGGGRGRPGARPRAHAARGPPGTHPATA